MQVVKVFQERMLLWAIAEVVVIPVQPVLRVVIQDQLVHKVLLVILVAQVHKVLGDIRVQQVHKASLDILDRLVHTG